MISDKSWGQRINGPVDSVPKLLVLLLEELTVEVAFNIHPHDSEGFLLWSILLNSYSLAIVRRVYISDGISEVTAPEETPGVRGRCSACFSKNGKGLSLSAMRLSFFRFE
jgi:hypothetical protein